MVVLGGINISQDIPKNKIEKCSTLFKFSKVLPYIFRKPNLSTFYRYNLFVMMYSSSYAMVKSLLVLGPIFSTCKQNHFACAEASNSEVIYIIMVPRENHFLLARCVVDVLYKKVDILGLEN